MTVIISLHDARRRDEEFVVTLATILALEFEGDSPTANEIECFLEDLDELVAAARDDDSTHYEIGLANSRDALEKLDDDEKADVALTDTLGGRQEMQIISESGLSLPRRARR